MIIEVNITICHCCRCPHACTDINKSRMMCSKKNKLLYWFGDDEESKGIPTWCPLYKEQKAKAKQPKDTVILKVPKPTVFCLHVPKYPKGYELQLFPVLKSYWKKNKCLYDCGGTGDTGVNKVLSFLGWSEIMEGTYIQQSSKTWEEAKEQLIAAGLEYSEDLEKFIAHCNG